MSFEINRLAHSQCPATISINTSPQYSSHLISSRFSYNATNKMPIPIAQIAPMYQPKLPTHFPVLTPSATPFNQPIITAFPQTFPCVAQNYNSLPQANPSIFSHFFPNPIYRPYTNSVMNISDASYKPKESLTRMSPTSSPMLYSEPKTTPGIMQDSKNIEIQENQNEDEKLDEKDESLRDLPDEVTSKRIIAGSAYRRRNVYKSIIRHMFSYVRKNREDITRVLKDAGFPLSEIEHAYCKINLYNDEERKKGSQKKSQNIVRNMVKETCIYTYILCETLYAMTLRWETGKMGKITRKNVNIYKEVTRKYYDECKKMLGRGAAGNNHLL